MTSKSLKKIVNAGPNTLASWVGPIVVTLLAAFIRLKDLGKPNIVMFDEYYYVKDSISLRLYGHERETVENINDLLIQGTTPLTDLYTNVPAYVSHPPFGKWVIASGELLFGTNPFGWRIAIAILGILSVLILARVLTRLTGSSLIGTLGGFLLAIDGLHIAMSRIALLDMTLMFLVLLAFALLVLDKEQIKNRVYINNPNMLGPRPYRYLAALALGLAIATKWSGIWFAVAFFILTIAWDINLRKQRGSTNPYKYSLFKATPYTLLILVTIVVATYLTTWAGWIFSEEGYLRNWASTQSPSFLPDWLRSLIYYHEEQLIRNSGTTATHEKQSTPWQWLLQTHPITFAIETPKKCLGEPCVETASSLGNPIIWWAGVLAILHQAWEFVSKRTWQSAAVVTGFLAGWLPWLFFPERTIFSYYAIVFLPYLIMAIALSLYSLLNSAKPAINYTAKWLITLLILFATLASLFFMPIWTSGTLTFPEKDKRMLIQSWR
jgi:dolichyl-phosphate-mannose-protein mannosyltransferase